MSWNYLNIPSVVSYLNSRGRFMDNISLKLLLLSLILAASPLQSSSAKLPSKDLCATSRPAGVIKVFPSEKSVQASVSSVGVEFNFSRQMRAHRNSFQLFVNGLDVTSKSRFSGTRDEPPSRVSISYNSSISKVGNYQAKVLFRTTDGSSNCYTWSFQVKRP
jgi:hypothetical protein